LAVIFLHTRHLTRRWLIFVHAKLRELAKAEKLAEEIKKLIIKKWHEHID
jgi:hypothetical protein